MHVIEIKEGFIIQEEILACKRPATAMVWFQAGCSGTSRVTVDILVRTSDCNNSSCEFKSVVMP